eukprot:gene7495-5281_t
MFIKANSILFQIAQGKKISLSRIFVFNHKRNEIRE